MKNVDVIVIGGSYAGMAAALQLARGRRQVAVIDAGIRRNRFAKSFPWSFRAGRKSSSAYRKRGKSPAAQLPQYHMD